MKPVVAFLGSPRAKRLIAIEWLLLVVFVMASTVYLMSEKFPTHVAEFWKSSASGEEMAPVAQSETSKKTYKLKIGGESFRVKADSPDELPSIADYLAEQYGLKPDAGQQAAPSPEAPTPAPEQPAGLPSAASEEARMSQALIKADAAGNADDARILAAEIRRMRSEQAAPAPAPVNKLTFRSFWYAVDKCLFDSLISGILIGILAYLAAWFPRLTFRAIRVVLGKSTAR